MSGTAHPHSGYMTTTEFARRFGMCRGTVRNHINAGHIKAVRIGATYRIPVSEVDRLAKPTKSVDEVGTVPTDPMDLDLALDAAIDALQVRGNPLQIAASKTLIGFRDDLVAQVRHIRGEAS